ncbi:MAG: hypothetical protein DIJKHBIC_02047 [Thermoanaerobaculia bacterium]|nr:hypothetical protein [Thermoanaerobaculia bacterium]
MITPSSRPDSLEYRSGIRSLLLALSVVLPALVPVSAWAAIPAAQRNALIDIYNSTAGASWTDRTNWLGAAGTECTWFGVTCDGGQTYVRVLNLRNNNLAGTIPTTVGNLTGLLDFLVSGNQLTGSIPSQLATIPPLEYLDLSFNQLSGSIPAAIWSMATMKYLYLNDNQLTGSMPGSIGSMTLLNDFRLENNQLTGGIPSDIGSLTQLTSFNFSDNRLTGNIPSTIGNVTTLEFLWLEGNAMAGALPTSMLNLTNLRAGNGLVIRANGFYSTDSALTTFLNSKDSAWSQSQTIPPSNVATSGATSASINVTWTPIPYTGDSGYYEVVRSTTSGGPYGSPVQTANKSASSITVSGLSSSTTYYFVVRTVTLPHANNSNTVTSTDSSQVSGTTLCGYTLNPTSSAPAGGGASGLTFQVQTGAGCGWTAVSNNPAWITITGGASGSGTANVTYNVAANVGPARTGTITAGGRTFTVNQASGCAANTTLSPASANLPAPASSYNSFQVLVAAGCPWTSTSNNPSWITISGGSSGNGNGWVYYDLTPNPGLPRTGTITAGGRTFTVNQADGCVANSTLSLYSANVPAAGATNQEFHVQTGTGCTWTSTANAGWITITGGASGTGNGPVNYDVAANPGGLRTGTITANGQTFTVNQATDCAYPLNPASVSLSSAAATGQTFQVQTTGTCPWTATSSDSWITLTGGTSGTGAGVVTYDVESNVGPARAGTIVVSGTAFTVNQGAGIPPAERQALIDIYNATGGPAWNDNSGWSTQVEGTECSWAGVVCDEGGAHVEALNLSFNNLSGTVPASIGNFSGLRYLYMAAGALTGPLPQEIGNLSNLISIWMSANQLSGPIPATIGNLSFLSHLDLNSNMLSGSIPAGIGNLTYLDYVDLSYNQIDGVIPAEIGSLSYLSVLELSHNRLGGAIPPEIGNLSYVSFLDLAANQLTGTIPASMSNLTNLALGEGLDLRLNGLHSTDGTLISFLNSRQAAGGDWQSTQTVAPEGVSAAADTAVSIQVTWTPITYTADPGYYEVRVSTVSGGPYSSAGVTADKLATSLTVPGLTPATPYYFVVRSVTMASEVNENTVTSEDSLEAFAATLPCSFALSPSSAGSPASGATGETFQVQVSSGCPWTAISNDTWITITGGGEGNGTGFVTYDVAANAGPARVGTITAGGQTFTVNQADGCAANTSLLPPNASFAWDGAVGQTFQIQVAGGCPWTAISNDSWITVTGGSAGSGTAPVTFDVAANTGPARAGTVTAGGQTFTVNQGDGCAANTTLVPTGISVGIDGVTDQTFQVQLAAACSWTVTANDSWITILGPGSRNGPSPVSYSVAANAGPARVGTITANGQTFTVSQADGCAANTSLLPTNASFAWDGAAGQTFQVQVAGGCPWTAISNDTWITVTGGSAGSGTALVTFDVAVNTGPARTGTITAGGQTFTVNQASGCAANTTLNPAGASIAWNGAGGQTFQIQVAGGCPWTAISNDAWITIDSGASGSGTGTVTYSVASNVASARTGTITAGGQTFTVNQASGCEANTSLVPTSAAFAWNGAASQTFQIQLAGGCPWTATSNDAWITITGGNSGSGTGTVTYTIATNVGPARTGTITAGSQTFTVDQASGCAANTTLNPGNVSVAWEGAAGQTFQVQVAGGCPWTAASNDAWITITGGSSGSGTENVTFTVAPNVGPARSGTITAGGQTFTVNEASGCDANTTLVPASVSLDATGAAGQKFEVQLAAGCTWTASSNDSWITITTGSSGSGPGLVAYSVAANLGPARVGTVTAGSRTFTVNQSEGCTANTSLVPASASVAASGAQGQAFQVQTAAGCVWTAASSEAWITITGGASGTGSGTVTFDVAANVGPARVGTITAGSRAFLVNQNEGCSTNMSLLPSGASVAASGAQGQAFQVQAAAGCTWAAVSSETWITITGGTSGTGSGTVTFDVAANEGPGRTGTIALGGRTFAVNQAEGCAAAPATLLPPSAHVEAAGASGLTFQVQKTTGCAWTASANEAWITLTGGGTGSGTGPVTYGVAANAGPARTGTITAAQQTFTVNQADGCTANATLVPANASLPAAGANGQTFQVEAADGCDWTAISGTAWITITSGTSGSGNGSVTYGVEANAGPARTGVITAAGHTFTVEQAASISPAERAALIALYDSANGQNWTNSSGWSSPTPGTECTWYGVVCSAPAGKRIPARVASPAPAIVELNLADNNLSGTIPEAIGDLTSLERLALNSNLLSGPVPASMGQLVNLAESGLDLRWNSVFTADGRLDAFLTSRQSGGNWKSTQTIAPTGVTASPLSPNSIRLTWTPILYTADPGYYDILMSLTPGGPRASVAQTASKGQDSLTVTGLVPGSAYFFTIRTVTGPHGSNRNTLTSADSLEVLGTTLPCSYALTPASAAVVADGAAGQTFRVETLAGCTWTATAHAAWISITSGATGDGDGSVTFSVAPNPGQARTGLIEVAGAFFTVTQAGACAVPSTPQFTSYPTAPVAAGNSFTLAWAPVLELPASGYYEVSLATNAECTSPVTITTPDLAITLPTDPARPEILCAQIRALSGTDCPPGFVSGYSSPITVRTELLPPSFTVIQGLNPVAQVKLDEAPPTGTTVVFRNVGSAPGTLDLSTTGGFFSVWPPSLTSIAPGADAVVTILFAPGSTSTSGVKQGNLVGAWAAPEGPHTLSTVITLTVLEEESPSTAGMKLEPVGSNLVYFRQGPGANPEPQQITVRNTGTLPVRIGPSIGPGGAWLQISGDFATPVPAGAERTFDLSVNRDFRTTEDGPPPLCTNLRIDNADGNPEDAAIFNVFDEEPPPNVAGTDREELPETEFSLILGSTVSTTASATSRHGLSTTTATQYLSDGWIRNRGPGIATVELYYTPEGAAGTTDPRVKKNTLSVPGYTAYRLSDFVKGLFGETGSGTVELRSTHLPQLAVRTLVDSITTRDGIPVQYGAEIPLLVTGQGITLPGPDGPVETIVLAGLKGPLAGYRSNVILSETSGASITVRATLFDNSGNKLGEKVVFVEAYSKTQVNHVDPDLFPVAYRDGTVEISSVAGQGSVSAFASVLDNRSQSHFIVSGTVVVSAPAPRKALHATSSGFLPAVVQEKSPETFYTTRVAITNSSESEAALRVTFIPEPGHGEPPEPRTLQVPGREAEADAGPRTVVFEKVLEELFEIEDGSRGMLQFEGDLGSLVFSTETSTPLDLENPELGRSVSSLTPAPGADPMFPGVFSVSSREILGVKLSETDTVKPEVSLPAIEENSQYQTHLILAELGGAPARVKVVLRKTGGAALGEPLVIDLAASERKQIDRIILASVKPPSGGAEFKDIEIVVQAVEGKGRTLALVSRISRDPKSRRMDSYVLGPPVSGSAKKGKK